jgi:hypothetical protein
MAHGGARPGAGRQPGVPNKVKREIAEAAQEYSEAALRTLAEVMTNGDSAAARVAAANSILDRAHGKPAQAMKLSGDQDSPIQQVIRWAQSSTEATPDPSRS